MLQTVKICVKLFMARDRVGPTPKGGKPMSTVEVISLMTLVIAAISLGYRLGKDIKK